VGRDYCSQTKHLAQVKYYSARTILLDIISIFAAEPDLSCRSFASGRSSNSDYPASGIGRLVTGNRLMGTDHDCSRLAGNSEVIARN
jgi:hypothetical protein